MRDSKLLMTAFSFFLGSVDILFLDFNGSAGEVAAAKAAAKRGEKLIVLPQISTKRKSRKES